MEDKNTNKKLIVSVSSNDKQYFVDAPEGTTLNEIMFGLSVIVRCLHRDGFLESVEQGLDMIKRYSTDSQFTEVKEEIENAESKEKA